MLIEKKDGVQIGDTICFRLITGEELIAKLTAQDDASITISKPVVAQMQMISPTQAGLAFGPFMATADDATTKFRFTRDRLLADPVKPRADINANYIKMTTGLDVPATPSILTK